MRKFVGLAIAIIALLSFATVAEGAVAVKDNYADQERYVGEATTLIVEGQNVSSDGSQVTILANGHKGDVTQMVSNVSNILAAHLAFGVIDRNALDYTNNYSTALANGTPGQMITIILTAVTSGTWLITDDEISSAVFTMTNTGWDDIALGTALDSVTLLYVDDTYGWIVIGENGATIT